MKKRMWLGVLYFLITAPAWSGALDLGGAAPAADTSAPAKVEVTNEQPVKVIETGTSRLIEITPGAQIESQEEYHSPYIDVQGYRTVNFYAVPEKVLNQPHANIRYKMDAYFSVEMTVIDYKKMGKEESENIAGGGWQEFGMAALKEEGSAENPVFAKPTTGETGSRVLSTPVYGPYVRVVLKNLTPGERRKFRIIAYLSR